MSQTGFRASFESSLTQTGGNVTGSFGGGGGCLAGGKFEGSVSGDTVRGTVKAGDVQVTLNGTISATQVDGTYEIPFAAGACPVDRGSFSMTRSSEK